MLLLIGEDNEVERFIDESKFSELRIWERSHKGDYLLILDNLRVQLKQCLCMLQEGVSVHL